MSKELYVHPMSEDLETVESMKANAQAGNLVVRKIRESYLLRYKERKADNRGVLRRMLQIWWPFVSAWQEGK